MAKDFLDQLMLTGFSRTVEIMRGRAKELEDRELNELANQIARLSSEVFQEISRRRGRSN